MRRFVFAPRWVAGHVLILVAVVSCVLLGRWQWHVSQHTHSLQNLAYALQWPMFAVFFALMWWRMLRLESRKLDGEFGAEVDAGSDGDADAQALVEDADAGQAAGAESAGGTQPAAPDPAVVAPAAPLDDADDAEERQLAAYNRMLAELAARDQAAR